MAALNSLLLLLGAGYGLPVLPALLAGGHSMSFALYAGHWRVILAHDTYGTEEIAPASKAPPVGRLSSGVEVQQDGDHEFPLADDQPIPARAWRVWDTGAPAPASLAPQQAWRDPLATIAWWLPPPLAMPILRELSTIVLLI